MSISVKSCFIDIIGILSFPISLEYFVVPFVPVVIRLVSMDVLRRKIAMSNV